MKSVRLNNMSWINSVSLETILLSLSPIIIYITGKRVGNSYKLCRDSKVKSNQKVFITPEIEKKNGKVEGIICEEFFRDSVIDFVKVVTENFDEKNLINLYNNASNLVVVKDKMFFMNLVSGTKYYGYYSNSAIGYKEIHSRDIGSVYHELFHMMSSTYYNGVFYDGFQQSNDKFDIGGGLNEGYTELLTQRYFGDKKKRKSYPLEMNFASMLEKVIGKDKMENAYMNCDLPSIISELKQYESEENVMSFITNLDFFNKYFYERNVSMVKHKFFKEKLREASLFVTRCYIKKLKNEFNNGEINGLEVIEKLNEYQRNITTYYEKCNIKYKFVEDYEVVSEMSDIWDEDMIKPMIA